MERILAALLDCGSLDVCILEDVGYDLGEITEDLVLEGVKPTLNAITEAIFIKGMRELAEAVEEAIKERIELQRHTDDTDDGRAKYGQLQKEIDELERLDPEEDMGWFCNCLDTSCWLENNEKIYRKYLQKEIRNIEYSMGFEFG